MVFEKDVGPGSPDGQALAGEMEDKRIQLVILFPEDLSFTE